MGMKGHKLFRHWTGANSGYANGRCECGEWVYEGWTDRMGTVVNSHKKHIKKITEKLNGEVGPAKPSQP